MSLPQMNAARTLTRTHTSIPVHSRSTAGPHRSRKVIQRAAALVGTPWAAVARWVEDEEYLHSQPVVSRAPKPPTWSLAEDYDITFRWPNSLRYAGANYDVVAHLHVKHNGMPSGKFPGGVWAEGLHHSHQNISQLAQPGSRYFTEYMMAYDQEEDVS